MENDVDRLGLPPSARVLIMAGLASTYGLFHGIGKGAKLASLRYLAENAHRLPRTKGTWYFFHKRKNYVILKDGINKGFVTAVKYGSVTALFFGLEAAIDRLRHRLTWMSTAGAAVGSGFLVSSFQGLPSRQLLRSVRNFALFGAFAGFVQDRVRANSQMSREARLERQEQQRKEKEQQGIEEPETESQVRKLIEKD